MRTHSTVPNSTAPPTMVMTMKMKMSASVRFRIDQRSESRLELGVVGERHRPTGARIEIVLQDDRRRGGVQTLLARAPVLFPHSETAFGFVAGQPLVLEHDGQAGAY